MRRQLAATVMAVAGACGPSHGTPPADEGNARSPAFPARGSTAPAFELPVFYAPPASRSEAGRTVRLSEQRGHVVALSFWSTTCVPCIEKHPALDSFAVRSRHLGVRVFGILVDDSPSRALKWLGTAGGANFPMLYDGDGAVARRYLVHGIPQMDLIGPDGRLAWHCLGCAEFVGRFEVLIDSMIMDRVNRHD